MIVFCGLARKSIRGFIQGRIFLLSFILFVNLLALCFLNCVCKNCNTWVRITFQIDETRYNQRQVLFNICCKSEHTVCNLPGSHACVQSSVLRHSETLSLNRAQIKRAIVSSHLWIEDDRVREGNFTDLRWKHCSRVKKLLNNLTDVY